MNTELKNIIAPWSKKGRWHHFFIESNGTTPKMTLADITVTLHAANIEMPEHFIVVDYKVAPHSVIADSGKSYNKSIMLNAAGKQHITIPAASNYDYMDVWVFGYIDD